MANKFETLKNDIETFQYLTRGNAGRAVKLTKLKPAQKFKLLKLVAEVYDARDAKEAKDPAFQARIIRRGKPLTAEQQERLDEATRINEASNGHVKPAPLIPPDWVEPLDGSSWVMHSLSLFAAARILQRVSQASGTSVAELCAVVESMSKLEADASGKTNHGE